MTNDIPSFMSTIIYRCRYISKRLYKTKINNNNKLAHQNSNLFKPSIHIYYHMQNYRPSNIQFAKYILILQSMIRRMKANEFIY